MKKVFRENQKKILLESRHKAGLSQKDVAEAMGYTSPQFVSNIERGLVNIPVESMKKLARVLKMSPRDLVRAHIDDYAARTIATVLGSK